AISLIHPPNPCAFAPVALMGSVTFDCAFSTAPTLLAGRFEGTGFMKDHKHSAAATPKKKPIIAGKTITLGWPDQTPMPIPPREKMQNRAIFAGCGCALATSLRTRLRK